MELKAVIGRRRSMRFLGPTARSSARSCRRCSRRRASRPFWGNVQALGAVVIERASAPPEVVQRCRGTAIGGFQFPPRPVVIVWTLDWGRASPRRATDCTSWSIAARPSASEPKKTHDYRLDPDPVLPGGDGQHPAGWLTELDCGQGIAQATLVAYEGARHRACSAARTTRSCAARSACPTRCACWCCRRSGIRREDPEAGGQRPRLPFESRFSLNRWGDGFRATRRWWTSRCRDGMIRDTAPPAYRQDELRWLQSCTAQRRVR